jgi:cytoskeletal protein CcmA (bactofilin family)
MRKSGTPWPGADEVKNRARLSFVGLLGALVLFWIAPIGATTYQSGKTVNISPLHEIADDFYMLGDDARIDGTITGDLVTICNQVVIKGRVLSSANLVSRYADHAGSIDGSLRFLGERLTVGGRVGGSILALGSRMIISQGSVVEKDVTLSAGEVDLDGTVLGKAYCSAATIRITGQIGGDVTLVGEKITLSPPAVIRGSLTYRTEKKDQLTIEPGVTVIGSTTWESPDVKKAEEESNVLSQIAYRIASLLAAFLFGVIIIRLFKGYADEAVSQLTRRPSVSLASGLLGALAILLALIVLALSLIGTLAGNILLSDNLALVGVVLLVLSILMIPISSFVAISGAVILYTGKVIVGLVLGHLILKQMKPDLQPLNRGALLLGLAILTIGAVLPFVGMLVYFLTALIGAGAIILGVHNCRKGAPPTTMPGNLE